MVDSPAQATVTPRYKFNLRNISQTVGVGFRAGIRVQRRVCLNLFFSKRSQACTCVGDRPTDRPIEKTRGATVDRLVGWLVSRPADRVDRTVARGDWQQSFHKTKQQTLQGRGEGDGLIACSRYDWQY